MNKNEMLEMSAKVKKYKELECRIEEISDFIKLPEYVSKMYNGNESTRISLSITFGNGSDTRKVTIPEGSLHNLIIDKLKGEKSILEREMRQL